MKNWFIILVVIGIVLFGACNDGSNNTSSNADTPGVKTVDTSAAAVTTQSTTNFPSDIIIADLQDDSVFADGSQPTSWQNAGIDDPAAFKQFVKKLQHWVAISQKDSVASIVAFPLANPLVKDKESFIARYDTFVNDSVKAALKNQNLRQIFRNANGAMIGNGRIWLGQIQGGYAITAINNK